MSKEYNLHITTYPALNRSKRLRKLMGGSRSSIIYGGGGGASHWSQEIDKTGNKYLYTELPVVSAQGIVAYGVGSKGVSSIFDELILDPNTLKWEDGKLTVIGGARGGDLNSDEMWRLLRESGSQQIDKSHLTNALSGYATQDWVTSQGYLTATSAGSTYVKKTGDTMSGYLTIGSSSGGNGSVISKGSIELFFATPHIDFHFNNSTADYTSRIIESSSGRLGITGNLSVGSNGTGGYNLHVTGSFGSTGIGCASAFYTNSNNKSLYNDGVNGVYLGQDGSIYCTSAVNVNPTLQFFRSGATSQTGYIANVANGYLTVYNQLGVGGTNTNYALNVVGLTYLRGATYFGGHIIGGTASTYNIGASATPWNIGYINYLWINGNSSNYRLYVNGNSYFAGGPNYMGGHFYPDTTNTWNLGSSSLNWNSLYSRYGFLRAMYVGAGKTAITDGIAGFYCSGGAYAGIVGNNSYFEWYALNGTTRYGYIQGYEYGLYITPRVGIGAIPQNGYSLYVASSTLIGGYLRTPYVATTYINAISGNSGAATIQPLLSNSTNSAHTLFRTITNSGHYVAYLGIGDIQGFYGAYASRVASNTNGFDWRTYWDVTTGALFHSSSIASTSTTTGAFVVAGGVGIGGNLWAANVFSKGAVTAQTTSDIRAKYDFREFDACRMLLALGQIRQFKYKKDNKEAIGPIYQEVIRVLPQMDTWQEGDEYGSLNYIHPDYINLIAASCQQTITRVEVLEKENRELRREVEHLKGLLCQ